MKKKEEEDKMRSRHVAVHFLDLNCAAAGRKLSSYFRTRTATRCAVCCASRAGSQTMNRRQLSLSFSSLIYLFLFLFGLGAEINESLLLNV